MKYPRGYRLFKSSIYKRNFIREISLCLQRKLTQERFQRLTTDLNKRTYNLQEQLFTRIADNRYCRFLKREEMSETIENGFEKYKFILESNLDPQKIKHICIGSLINSISYGSGVYFLWWDTGSDIFWACKDYRDLPPIKRTRYRDKYKKSTYELQELIQARYPKIPEINLRWRWKRRSIDKFYRDYGDANASLDQQLVSGFSYPIYLLIEKKGFDESTFYQEFLRRYRWFFERLSNCSPIFLNKYKEEICRGIYHALNADSDRSYYIICHSTRDPVIVKENHDFNASIVEAIVNCLSQKELTLLETKNSEEKVWSFRDQLMDRFCSKYPSFADPEELREHVVRKVEEYRDLIGEDNVEVLKDVLMEEIDSEVFVSLPTHLWNLEMAKNLELGKVERPNKRVAKAIDRLISRFPKGALERLSIEINGRIYGVKEQLIARWRDSLFGSTFKSFGEFLDFMPLKTFYSLENWGKTRGISRMDLQILLEEIDMFFLYPKEDRRGKRMIYRLDNGRNVGGKNLARMFISVGAPEDVIGFLLVVLIFIGWGIWALNKYLGGD